jgi:hypothetical protein
MPDETSIFVSAQGRARLLYDVQEVIIGGHCTQNRRANLQLVGRAQILTPPARR